MARYCHHCASHEMCRAIGCIDPDPPWIKVRSRRELFVDAVWTSPRMMLGWRRRWYWRLKGFRAWWHDCVRW